MSTQPTTTTNDVLAEVQRVRQRQDQKWGGPTVEDQGPEYWARLIVDECANLLNGRKPDRRTLVDIAAMAVLAVEQIDTERGALQARVTSFVRSKAAEGDAEALALADELPAKPEAPAAQEPTTQPTEPATGSSAPPAPETPAKGKP